MKLYPSILTAIFAGLILFGSLISITLPLGPVGPVIQLTLLAHFFAYGLLASLAYFSSNKSTKSLMVLSVVVVLYGVGIELIQGYFGRCTSILDAVANSAGVLISVPFLESFRK